MATQKTPMPPVPRLILRVTAAVALLAFLLPTVFVVYYFAWDAPRARQRAALLASAPSVNARRALLQPLTPDNLLLQERVAQADADPMLRREAVIALGANLQQPGFGWRHPLQAGVAKAALADVATHDRDPLVRQAASIALSQIAQAGGAVIRR